MDFHNKVNLYTLFLWTKDKADFTQFPEFLFYCNAILEIYVIIEHKILLSPSL
jgi:hypothetical protein